MWLALFGPSLLGLSESVRPGTSPIPFSRTFKKMTARSGPQMHPLTDFLFLSPVLLGLYKVVSNVIIKVRRKPFCYLLFLRRILTLWFTRIPYFMANPCLSLPPVILRVYPLNSSPITTPSTSDPILRSLKWRLYRNEQSVYCKCVYLLDFVIINFLNDLLSGGRVRNVVLLSKNKWLDLILLEWF